MYNKFPCYYPGDFNPPTKYHLNTMEWLLGRPEIGHVYIVIGNNDQNQLTQEKKVKLWEMLIRHSFSPNVSILKSKEDHALNEIKNALGKKRETPFFIAMDEKMARNRDMQEHFSDFSNFQIEIIPSQFNKSSQQMIQAVLDKDDKTIRSLIPHEFSDQSAADYVNIMKKQNDPEAPDEKSPTIDYKTHYINKFNDGFWKEVFEPMVNEEISYAEATNEFDALQTVLDKKRDIAFLVKDDMSESSWLKIQEMIKEGGLKTMFIKGNEGDAYVVYRPGKEKDATELKDIAEKHGGYLKYDAPAEDTRRIGQLLSYKPNEIEDYIKKHSPKKESLNEEVEDLQVPKDAYTGNVYSNNSNVWTHVTRHDAAIEDIKRKGKWLSRGENLDHFVYGTEHTKGKKFHLSKDNKSSVYMKKGGLYLSEPTEKYSIKWLITTDLSDDAFQPNINGGNTDTLEQSHDIGVLKPEYRDIKNFKFYRFNPEDKKWYEFDINKLK